MKVCGYIGVVFCVIALCGCTTTQQYYGQPDRTKIEGSQINENQARIILSKPKAFGGCAAKYNIYDNGQIVGLLGSDGNALVWDRNCGAMILEQSVGTFGKKNALPINVEPCKEYHFALRVNLVDGAYFELSGIKQLHAISTPKRSAKPVVFKGDTTQNRINPDKLENITPLETNIVKTVIIAPYALGSSTKIQNLDMLERAILRRNICTNCIVDSRKDTTIESILSENEDTLILTVQNLERGKEEWVVIYQDWGNTERPVIPVWYVHDEIKSRTVPAVNDVTEWTDRIELLAQQKSLNDVNVLKAILEKGYSSDKKRYVFQSFPGFSLCTDDPSSADGAVYMVVGIGQPYYADKTSFHSPLYWCGTYTYQNKMGDTKTVYRYAQDIKRAMLELKSQLHQGNTGQNKSYDNSAENSKSWGYQTGFFVSDSGHLITCAHGVIGKGTLQVQQNGKWEMADTVAMDQFNDLALLKINSITKPLQLSNKLPEQGSDITVWGYPLPEMQGVKIKATRGIISSHTGIQDDIRTIQIDAAVQPGNSGSPVLSETGQAIAIVSSRLNDILTFALTANLPQNVSYALKASYINSVLECTGINNENSTYADNIEDAVVLIRIAE